MDAQMGHFVPGMIILWSGAVADIPLSWRLCDGSGGTPNLENSFVVGAGDTYVVGASGGAANHAHAFTGDGHTHDLAAGGDLQAGSDYDKTIGSEVAAGDTDAASSLPPYYALCYIMKR